MYSYIGNWSDPVLGPNKQSEDLQMSADFIFEKCTLWIQIRTEHVLEELSLWDGSYESAQSEC